MEGNKYTVYVIENQKGQKYIGQTNNLPRRLFEHNNPEKVKYSSRWMKFRGPWNLIHKEIFTSRSAAMHREKNLKGGRGRDFLNLLRKTSPGS
ncbi:GIY-YIG nuclease family protein [Patescibacteria group bacterium]